MSTTLRNHLQAIRDEHGALNSELVVEVATDPKHPLHSRFEWDDSIAGHKYRLEQAGQLLRVTFRPIEGKPTELRAFVAVKGEDSHTSDYQPSEEAFADPFTAEIVLRAMKREAQAFTRRWKDHAAYADTVRGMQIGEAS